MPNPSLIQSLIDQDLAYLDMDNRVSLNPIYQQSNINLHIHVENHYHINHMDVKHSEINIEHLN